MTSRAMLRQIEPGQGSDCHACKQPIKFQAQITRTLRRKVVCNVYEDEKWNRIEQYHMIPCYATAGMPYGPPQGASDEDLRRMQEAISEPDKQELFMGVSATTPTKAAKKGTKEEFLEKDPERISE